MHPDAVRQVNVTNRQNYDKLQSYDVVRKYILGNGLLASNGELWRRQRKLMSPFYTPKAVQTYGDTMLKDGYRLLERWSHMDGHTVENGEEMTYVTAAINLRAMFSMKTDEEIIGMKSAVETIIGYSASNQTGMMIPLWIPTRKNRAYEKARAMVHSYIDSLIEQRRSLPEADWPNDLLTRLMQARDEETGEPMSESLLATNRSPRFLRAMRPRPEHSPIRGMASSDEGVLQHFAAATSGLGYCDPLAPAIYPAPIPNQTGNELVPFSYTVTAYGNPAPTFSLTTKPAGMTINGTTGVISWTPAAGQAGARNVTVMAANSAGTDSQSFVINVTANSLRIR